METFCADSVLRGYHIYKGIPWEPAIGTILPCEREAFNLHDPYAVAAMNHGVVVSHVSRSIAISALCSIFLRRGVIYCEITGTRQHSSDLPQGGLELPCKLKFSAASKERPYSAALFPILAFSSGENTDIFPMTSCYKYPDLSVHH